MNKLSELLIDITKNKFGLEIGGPSSTGRTLYENAELLDNVIFSENTVWSSHTSEYKYHGTKVGKVYINDATDITSINESSYDFVFASHTLEHIANPLKALKEWIRVTKTNGYIILILPEHTCCFDHNRQITPFNKILKQYQDDVGEDDLASLAEILKLYDLSMDSPAGNFEQFTRRSLDNFKNRCLHHHVYSPDLLKTMCEYVNCEFIYTVTDGLNIWFVIKK